MTDSLPLPVDVAVGVLTRADGCFLLAQRPAGKPMPGYWEFPGGKLERGETVRDALRREFLEELDIEITDSHPWAVRIFTYPHATVRLHFWRARAWRGTVRGLENQAFRWEDIRDPCVEPWLPGALPLRRWLALPDWYAISSATSLGVTPFLARLDREAGAGRVRLLQLREKDLDDDWFAALFREVSARADAFGFKLLVNSHHPERYWHACDGVHLTQADLDRMQERPEVNWCAASCHGAQALARAAALGADFAVLGPVLPTATHPGRAALGWRLFEEQIALTPLPVYAIGGLARAELEVARVSGAQGVAAIRASWD